MPEPTSPETSPFDKSAREIKRIAYTELMDDMERSIQDQGPFAIKLGLKDKDGDRRAFLLNAPEKGIDPKGNHKTSHVFVTVDGPFEVHTSSIPFDFPEVESSILKLLKGNPPHKDSRYEWQNNKIRIGVEYGRVVNIPLQKTEATIVLRANPFEGSLAEKIAQALDNVHSPKKETGNDTRDIINAKQTQNVLRRKSGE